MATEVQIGGNGTLFVGEDKTLRLEVLDVAGKPVNAAGWTIRFQVRLKDTSPDPPLIDKIANVVGVFNTVRASNTQRAEVVLDDDADTNQLKAKTYRHSWKRTDESDETTLARGDFVVEVATTSRA